jgi:hypothetical protein
MITTPRRADACRRHSVTPSIRALAAVSDRVPGNQGWTVDERSARLATNEAIFRAGNERIDAMLADKPGRTPYLCECGDAECFERVELTNEEYEAVRAHPARFFTLPGHEDVTAGEVVVETSAAYTVVEKRGEEAEVVERSDPRAL